MFHKVARMERAAQTFAVGLLLWVAPVSGHADDSGNGPNLLEGDFESGRTTYNPWAGVDDSGNLHVLEGNQLCVSDDGNVGAQAFSPSVAAGDLTGDGLTDLVVADAHGFFWFYHNSGKPNAPVFTRGEIIPVWLGVNSFDGDVVPRIQLVDYGNEKKLDLVAGTYRGELYYIHNDGTSSAPLFNMPKDPSTIQVATHKKGLLWCNYLAPCLFDWSRNGILDLVMGDGTYSANSIYLFKNSSDNASPVFDEDHFQKLIPGMGSEDLTPQVVDWNNDGKPDIIAGDRTGHINLYLNKAATKGDSPVFDENGTHVTFGSSDQVGEHATVCVADLNHDGLFDLILGNPDGSISYALNQGTLGAPKFGTLLPLKGTYPYRQITVPYRWSIVRNEPYGLPNQVLECTNAQVESGFQPPPGFAGKEALKFSVLKPQNTYFKTVYQPLHTEKAEGDLKHNIVYNHVNIQTDTRYIVSFWVRADGDVSNLNYRAEAWQESPKGSGDLTEVTQTSDEYPVNSIWTRVSEDLKISSLDDSEKTSDQDILNFKLNWDGDGTIYFDDISIKKAD